MGSSLDLEMTNVGWLIGGIFLGVFVYPAMMLAQVDAVEDEIASRDLDSFTIKCPPGFEPRVTGWAPVGVDMRVLYAPEYSCVSKTGETWSRVRSAS